jgi:hypothetical protein
MHSMPELKDVATTSFSLKNIYGCLRLKLWDPESNEMIGLSELDKK